MALVQACWYLHVQAAATSSWATGAMAPGTETTGETAPWTHHLLTLIQMGTGTGMTRPASAHLMPQQVTPCALEGVLHEGLANIASAIIQKL